MNILLFLTRTQEPEAWRKAAVFDALGTRAGGLFKTKSYQCGRPLWYLCIVLKISNCLLSLEWMMHTLTAANAPKIWSISSSALTAH